FGTCSVAGSRLESDQGYQRELCLGSRVDQVGDRRGDAQEVRDQRGVELRSEPAVEDLGRVADAAPRSVRPVAGHGIEGVGDRDDASLEGYLLGSQPRWVAGPIEALVVGQRDRCREFEQVVAGIGEQSVADRGMPLEHGAFGVGERSWLVQDAVWYPDLPDVVETAGHQN